MRVRGYFGSPAFSAFTRAATMADEWAKIKKAGDYAGVVAYGEGDALRVMLAHRTRYNAAANSKAAWQQSAGTAANFEAIPAAAFSGATGGLDYSGNDASRFVSASAIIRANGAHSIDFFIPKPDESAAYPIWIFRWGGGDARWSLEVTKGAGRIVRLLPTWNAFDEGALWLMRALESPTAAQQTQMQAYEKALCADDQSLSLSGSDEWYGAGHEISFIPGAAGGFTARIEGGESVEVENSALKKIAEQRGPNDTRLLACWPLSYAEIGSNGGPYGWRVGAPSFAASGYIETPRYI